MTKIIEIVAIQFIKGKDEKGLPEIRIFRSFDGKKGQVIYKFYNPKTVTLENLNSIKKMYLIDKEGELSTREIDISVSDKKNMELKSTYNWKTEKEFERFMRFAKRYANSLANS